MYQHVLHCWDPFIKLFECYFSNIISAAKKNLSPSVKSVTYTTAGEKDFHSHLKLGKGIWPTSHSVWKFLPSFDVFDLFFILRKTSTNKRKQKVLVLTVLSPWLNPSVAHVLFRNTSKPLFYTLRNISAPELVMIKVQLQNSTWGQNTFLTCCQVLSEIA